MAKHAAEQLDEKMCDKSTVYSHIVICLRLNYFADRTDAVITVTGCIGGEVKLIVYIVLKPGSNIYKKAIVDGNRNYNSEGNAGVAR